MKRIAERHRRVAGALALATAAALALSGCGGGTSPAQGGADVTFWHYYAQGIPATKKYTADLKSIYADETKKQLDAVFVPSDQLTQKVIASAGSKQGPDVFVQGGSDLLQLAEAGAIADFTSEFEAFPDKDQIPDTAVIRVDGKVYGVQGFANTFALWYNKGILDEFGIAPPTTMDALGDALAKIGTRYVGFALPGQGSQDGSAFSFITAYGFDYAKPDAAALQQSFAKIADWSEKGYIPRDAATWTGDVAFQKFTAGGVAFVLGGNWQYGNAKTAAKFAYGAIPVPDATHKAQVYMLGDNVHMGAFTKDKKASFDAIAAMFLSKKGELAALEAGSMPLRKDLADTPGLQDPIYAQFKKALENGQPYLLPGFGTELTEMRTAVGQAWSSVIAGQANPKDAAASAVDTIKRLEK